MSARNYCFTVNNYTEADIAKINVIPHTYLVYGFEEAPTTGTRHLQGYIQLEKKQRPSYLHKRMPTKAHIEIARATAPENRTYCTKSAKFYEDGVMKTERTNTATLYDQITKAETWQQVLRIDGIERRLDFAREVFNNKPPNKMENVILRGWQQELYDVLMKEPDDRTIYYVYDKKGGKGKTYLCKYLVANHGAFYFSPAKGTDIYYAYQNQGIILMDIPRSTKEEVINWGVCEKLKDGIFLSSKYNSVLKNRQRPAHLVIFSNQAPPEDEFSEDRLKVIDLGKVKTQMKIVIDI